ncbi:hypothetical protein KVL50_04825 [Helicobacter pylori]|nr:hypothetical protein KVL50_04825 [Helicobacter pylori]
MDTICLKEGQEVVVFGALACMFQIADNTALFKSGNAGRCRDREMFFSLAFLFNFIIDCFCLFGGFLLFYKYL